MFFFGSICSFLFFFTFPVSSLLPPPLPPTKIKIHYFGICTVPKAHSFQNLAKLLHFFEKQPHHQKNTCKTTHTHHQHVQLVQLPSWFFFRGTSLWISVCPLLQLPSWCFFFVVWWWFPLFPLAILVSRVVVWWRFLAGAIFVARWWLPPSIFVVRLWFQAGCDSMAATSVAKKLRNWDCISAAIVRQKTKPIPPAPVIKTHGYFYHYP